MQRIVILVVIGLTLFISIPLLADDHSTEGLFSFLERENDHEKEEHSEKDGNRFYKSQKKISGVSNELYKEECGSCHMAYQPELLPEESWVKVMKGLSEHFGDSAEFDAKDAQSILKYLKENSADKSEAAVSKKLLRRYKGNAPLRISQLPYFIHEHDEIRANVLKRPKIKSWANCAACHRMALQGDYSERNIKIPR
ncbi:MAG: diheme cytochrome c [SAR324 cluster bacterium]|nr:diheme cytochrome c [SAR324 cluster bacterium]